MPSIKDLFNKDGKDPAGQTLSMTSLQELSGTAESSRNIRANLKNKKRFVPPVDYSDPKNFAKFGSAEEYYTQSIKRIYRTYPYDGS